MNLAYQLFRRAPLHGLDLHTDGCMFWCRVLCVACHGRSTQAASGKQLLCQVNWACCAVGYCQHYHRNGVAGDKCREASWCMTIYSRQYWLIPTQLINCWPAWICQSARPGLVMVVVVGGSGFLCLTWTHLRAMDIKADSFNVSLRECADSHMSVASIE